MKRGNRRAVLGTVLAVAFVLGVAQGASAGILINVGTHLLAPNTPGQTIQIFVSTTDANRIGGCNLNAQVDGAGPPYGGIAGPVITEANLVAGTIFAGNNSGQTDLGSVPMLAMYSIVTNSGTVEASGLLVTLTIDTTGYFTPGQTWTLQLGNTLNGATDFAPTAATIVDGSITLTPEPGTLALLGLGAAGLLRRRRARA